MNLLQSVKDILIFDVEFFQPVDQKHTLNPASWIQNQGLLCKTDFPAVPLLCSGSVVYLLFVNLQ